MADLEKSRKCLDNSRCQALAMAARGREVFPNSTALNSVDGFGRLGREKVLGQRTFDAVVAVEGYRKCARRFSGVVEWVRIVE